jgi:hypothetical protein
MNFHSSGGSNFDILVGARLDSTKAGRDLQKQLKELEQVSVVNVKVKFAGKDAIKQITTYKDALGKTIETVKMFDANMKQLRNSNGTFAKEGGTVVNKIKDMTNSIKNLTEETISHNTSTGKMVQTINKFKDGILEGTTEVEKYRNAMGQLVTETTKFDAQGRQLGAVERQVANDTRIITTEVNKYIDAQGREITEIKKLNSQRDGEIERITKQTNAQGQLVTTTEKVLVAQGREKRNTSEVTTVIERDTTATKENTQSKESNSEALRKQLGITNDFISTMGKVIKFQIITKIITGFTTACRESINVIKEFDSALTEFKKVSDLSGSELDSYTQKLGDLGTAVARTRTQMVEASTQFKKSGFSDEDSAQLAQVSSLYQNIADSELSAGESATFIISQMKAFEGELERFNDEATKATFVIDAINEVSNNMAVSSSDIALALSKTASAMSALGNDYEESIALVTSG